MTSICVAKSPWGVRRVTDQVPGPDSATENVLFVGGVLGATRSRTVGWGHE